MKDIADFPPHGQGVVVYRMHECRACHNAKWSPVREAAFRKRYHESQALRETVKQMTRERKAAHPELVREANRAYQRTQNHRNRVRTITKRAIKKGLLTRRPCEVCSSIAAEAHHEDYTKPLQVRWLCRDHHMELHRTQRRAAEALR